MTQHSLLKQQIEHAQQYVQKIKTEQEQGLYPKTFSMPVGLQFELTSKCNLYCKHCYNGSGDNHAKDNMTVADWKKLVDDLIKEGGIFQCIISGGEPLMLGEALYDIMDPLHEDGTGFILITNGMLVNKNTVQKFKKYNFYWIQVSIDDVLDTAHDDFRGKKGSWNKAVNAAYLVAGAGLPLRIAHSITAENLSRLPEMIDLAYKIGASSIVCGSILPSGRAVLDKALYSHQNSFLNKMYSMIEKYQCEYRGKMDILISSDATIDVKIKKEVPNSAVVIRPNGNVRVDCTMPFTVGNVLKDNITHIWRKLGANCWNHELINKYISELDECGFHPTHRNHNDLDITLR